MVQVHTVASVGELLCNIPAMLQFCPVESIILLELRQDEIGGILRLDLGDWSLSDAAERLSDLVDGHDADGALAVVVSEQVSDRARCVRMADELASALQHRGRELIGAVRLDRFAAGGRWSCLDGCGAGGVLDDPASSVLAAAAALDGRRIFGSRAEVAALVAVDASRAAALLPLLGTPGPVDSVPAAVRAAVGAIRQIADGGVPTDAELAEVATALVDKRVRDALLKIGDAEETAAAEVLWTTLARALPEPFRVEALTLLAFSALLRGDTVLGGVVLEAALAANPDHLMAGLLDTALQHRLPIDRLRDLVAAIPPAVTV